MIRIIKAIQVAVVCDTRSCARNCVSQSYRTLEEGVAELVRLGWKINGTDQALCPKHRDTKQKE